MTEKVLEEDSFSQYYNSDAPRIREKKEKAFQFKGEKHEQQDMEIAEISLPVKETLAKARSYGVSVTVLVAAMLLCAIHEEIPRNQQKKPLGLMIPVNLRNYFPSRSMANFFGWIEVRYHFQQNTSFTDVLKEVKAQFEAELSKERIGRRMSELVRLEKIPSCGWCPWRQRPLPFRRGRLWAVGGSRQYIPM